MMTASHSYEKRPLKKLRIGPPDVYPQDPRQKEDELTSQNVKHGFPTSLHLTDEFGTARNCNINPSKIGAFFNSIIARKEELCTLQDSGRKRQQINTKDNFWPVTGKTKTTVNLWFKDLAGNKPLMHLAKKAPTFNKKEEIFMNLCDNQVPMMRATWFIKLSSAFAVAISEAKIKKRQLADPTTEWTGTLLKFLKDQIPKMQEYYSQVEKQMNTTPSSTAPPQISEADQKQAVRYWLYGTELLKFMTEEGLIDRQELLNWIIELLEKMRSQPHDDGLLRLYLPLALQYLDDFVQSELLSRRLAHLCCKKLGLMLNSSNDPALMTSPLNLTDREIKIERDRDREKEREREKEKEDKKEMQTQSSSNNPYHTILQEYQNCAHHRDVVLQLSCVIETICLECPTSLVWCGVGIGTVWHGSPLDFLPVAPSTLPIPAKCEQQSYRKQVQQVESNVQERSKRAESRWCMDKVHQSSTGTITNRVLAALDALDRHRFDRMDTSNSLDTLYTKVFHNNDNENAAVKLLCEWAVSPERAGEHRALAVAALLDRRQSDANNNEQEAKEGDDKDSNVSVPGGPPLFQSLLMKFLDADAPVPLPDDGAQKKTAFSNLVHLFSELIRRDVFSHDAYMCTLISRGDLLGQDESSQESQLTHPKLEEQPHQMDYDDFKVDADLDKILQDIKEDQQNSMDIPDSPKDHDHSHHAHHVPTSMGAVAMETDHTDSKTKLSRHFIYTTHFPLCQDDPFSQHDCNQRHVLLYGVGKVRDEARHTVKKMSKEICKLFSKKFSIDVAEGGKVKKHSRNEFNFEATTTKCQSLSYFDQHVVTYQCSVTVVEMLNSFATGGSNYLPVQEHVAFLFDLMELALNIYGLIDVCIQILKELPEVEAQLFSKNSVLARNYTTGLSLYVVGVLRRYHCCLLLSPDQTSAVFEGLCRVVKHVSNPGDCSSAERCILAHLYDLYSSCSLLKSKPHTVEPFGNAYPKIRQALYTALQPTPSSSYIYNAAFMQEVFASPRRGGKVESTWVRQLGENVNNRYSFVSNAIMYVCRENDNERLNDLSVMCAEMTACCNTLAAEWLGALLALCCPMSHPGYYTDLHKHLDIQDASIHNALAVFTCILIARHCFSLEDFVGRVALPSLLKVKTLDNGGGAAEGGMRLTCHLLLRLFRTAEGPQPGLYSVGSPPLTPRPSLGVRLSCDRHLLAAAHRNIHVGPVLAVLKAIIVVGDATAKEGTEPISISHILGTSDHMGGGEPSLELTADMDICGARSALRQSNNGSNESTASLSAFACHVLREICSQQWVLERCLCHPEELCHHDNLLDPVLSHSQAQRLLHMICYPDISSTIDELDQKSMITRILENLELWTLRMSWLDLQLMFKQFSANSPELSQWLETVARAAIDVFQLSAPMIETSSEEKKHDSAKKAQCSIWLVAPLISKLPSAVQGRVLKVAGQVLEANGWTREPKIKHGSQSILSHQPFLSLVLSCLKNQEDGQREGLLSSLHNQLSQLVSLAREGNLTDICNTERTLDGLQLRFSLVGGVFESFQRSISVTTDWALLLVQLVTNNLVDLHTHSDLFTTVIDMLATLVHSALATDQQDEGRKMYFNLTKKLKREIGERQSSSLQHIRQLLPLTRVACELIAVEPTGCITDNKGNKISFDSIDKKHGLQVSDKQKVSPWDVLEGMKNPAPLSWAWFGAVRLERRPLACEDTHRLLKYHTHNLQKPPSHYLEPPPLPPEDLEPVPDKPLKELEMKADTPSSVDQSPHGATVGKKGQKRGRTKKAKAAAAAAAAATPPTVPVPTMMGQSPLGQTPPAQMQGMQNVSGPTPPLQHMGYGGMPQQTQQPPQPQQFQTNPNQGQQQWYNQQQQQPQAPQQQPQTGYYPGPQQMPNAMANRFERPQMNQSKAALSNMLRQRHPLNTQPFMGGPQGQQAVPGPAPVVPQGGYPPGMQRQFPRQPGMRQQHPAAMQAANQGMFPQQYSNMQPGMNQQYAGNYGGNQMMQGNQQIMQGGQNSAMFQQQQFAQTRAPQPDYRGMAQAAPPRAQYMQQAPNVTMNATMSNPMAGMGAAQGPAPPYSRAANQAGVPMNPGMGMQQQQQQQNQFQQQQRMRQQMQQIAMQQQQQQQQQQHQQQQQGGAGQVPGGPQQQAPALVAHLRQMNSNQYPQQPPPYNMG